MSPHWNIGFVQRCLQLGVDPSMLKRAGGSNAMQEDSPSQSDAALAEEAEADAKKESPIPANVPSPAEKSMGTGGQAKEAQIGGRPSRTSPYPGMGALAFQQFAPIARRRQLTTEEQGNVAKGQRKFIPKIWQSYQTPMWQLLSSPAKSSLMAGLPAAAIGGALGGAVAHNTGTGAALGAAVAGIPTAVLAYYARKRQNEDILELMRRLPEGATKRDMLSDPAVQADLERMARLRAAELAARSED